MPGIRPSGWRSDCWCTSAEALPDGTLRFAGPAPWWEGSVSAEPPPVAAALELGRRLRIEEGQQIDSVRTDQDIVAMFQPQLGALPYEEFWAVYLNASNRVIDRMRVSQGGVSATVVDHRLIVKRAVEKLANALVLVHNHPSGNELPSDEDKALTGRVDLAASLFDITLLDHVIVTAGPCYSFRSHGFFDKRPNP